jgi:hypothetical protein
LKDMSDAPGNSFSISQTKYGTARVLGARNARDQPRCAELAALVANHAYGGFQA